MDLLNMLMTAKVLDTDGDEIGDVLAIRIIAGHLVITVMTEDEEEEGDDGGGSEITPEEKAGLTLVYPLKEAAKGGGTGPF